MKNLKFLKFLTPFFILIILMTPVLIVADSHAARQLTPARQRFIKKMIDNIVPINRAIYQNRLTLKRDFNQFEHHSGLDQAQIEWVDQLAKNYKLYKFNNRKQKDWKLLLSRVDVIPASLALAQAANESAWGTSRFARQGNNYFGQWCSRPGCGLIPKRRPKGATYEVKKFASVRASVEAYIHNLNTGPSYKPLREIRARLREQKAKLHGVELAEGLLTYSARGYAYVVSIQNNIREFGFMKYDQHVWDLSRLFNYSKRSKSSV